MKTVTASKKTVAKLLRKGAANIEKYGWGQNTFGNTEVGFCALGAIRHETKFFRPDSEFPLCAYRAAVNALVKAIGGSYAGEIPRFNDSETTTKEDVLKLLRSTARKVEHGLKFEQKVAVWE